MAFWTNRNRPVAAALLAVAVAFLPQAYAAVPTGQAQRIFQLTNRDRQAQGLPALRWNSALAQAAEAHLRWMVQAKQLSHQYPGEPPLLERAARAGAHFRAIAENIAMGPGAKAINRGWMHSHPHRRNILDPRMDAVGVATAESGGYLYAVEDFAETIPDLNPQQVEQQVKKLLRAQGVEVFEPNTEARQACRMTRGMPRDSGLRLLVRFQTPNITQLPSGVVEQIRKGGFTKAAVGACSPEGVQGFTTYRVAILFY